MSLTSLMPWRRRWELTAPEEDPFAALHRDIDDLFAGFFGGMDLRSERLSAFTPRVDVAENDREIRLTAELPGMDEKDVDISLAGDVLTIKGEKKGEREAKADERHYRSERTYGAFCRSMVLPADVEADKIAASFKQGVLTIVLPKVPTGAKARQIPIATA